MDILTKKMVLARKRADAAYGVGANTKVFFPFDEPNGFDFTDIKSGVIFRDTDATRPDTSSIDNLLIAAAAPLVGTMPNLQGGHVLIMSVGTVNSNTSFHGFVLGDSTSPAGLSFVILGSSSQVISNKGAGVSAVNTTTIGQTACIAMLFNNTTGELRTFVALSGGAAAFSATADASLHLGAAATPNQIEVGFIVAQRFNAVFAHMPVTVPSDAVIIAAMNEFYANAIAGIKKIPASISVL